MDQQQPSKFQELIDFGYEFRFGEYLSQGFDILKQNIGGFIGFTLIYFMISYILALIPFLGGIVNSLIVSPCLMAGAFIVANLINTNQKFEFSNFFDGFKKLEKIAIASLLMNLVILAALIPMILVILAMGLSGLFVDFFLYPEQWIGSREFFPIWIFIFTAPAIYLSVAYSWMIPLIVFYDLDPWPALETSRKIITKQWWWVFAFIFVLGLLMVFGVILLFVGFLFAFPLFFCSQYAAFADVMGLHEEVSTDDDIIDHLVE